MKTTVEIGDDLLERARQYAVRTRRSVRSLIEEGLHLVLQGEGDRRPYTLPECSVGDPEAIDPLESLTWQDLRDEIYGGR